MYLHAVVSALVSPLPWVVWLAVTDVVNRRARPLTERALKAYGLGFAVLALPLIASRNGPLLHTFGAARACGLVGACCALALVVMERWKTWPSPPAMGLESYRAAPLAHVPWHRAHRDVLFTVLIILMATATAELWAPPLASLLPADARSDQGRRLRSVYRPRVCSSFEEGGEFVHRVALADGRLRWGSESWPILHTGTNVVDEQTANVLAAAAPVDLWELPFVHAGEPQVFVTVQEFVTQECRRIWVARPTVVDGDVRRAIETVWREIPKPPYDLIIDLATEDARDPVAFTGLWGRFTPLYRSIVLVYKDGIPRVLNRADGVPAQAWHR